MAEESPRRGRPLGGLNRLSKEAIATARASGDGRLPHEILLDIARGQPVELLQIDPKTGKLMVDEDGIAVVKMVVPDLEQVIDASKASAPYYAPKISTVEVIQGINDGELDAIIARAAAEAGVSIGTGGESPEDEGEEASSRADRARAVRTRRAAD